MLKLESGTTFFTDDSGKRVCTGSQNGRPDIIPLSISQTLSPVKLHLERLKWVDGDYDQGGAYWGCPGRGMYVYCAWGHWGPNDLFVQVFVKTVSRIDAKRLVRNKIATATFFH